MVHGVTGIAEMTAAHGWRIPWAAKCAPKLLKNS